MAVHVEDHPIEYLDFEGVIPAGEYGGGDVIVWDIGAWEPHETDDPAAAVERASCTPTCFGRSCAAGWCSSVAAASSRRKEQWLLLHKHDEHAVEGWDPEDHPRSVLSGRTNDEVKADPDRLWRSDRPGRRGLGRPAPAGRRPPRSELAALDELGAAGTWEVFGRELRLTNLDKVLFPGRDGEQPVTKRDLLRYAAPIAPVVLPYLPGRALNMHRFPNGAARPGFWHKELPEHAPDWLPRWDNPDADQGETTPTWWSTSRPRWCGRRTSARWSGTPGRR